ncbi:MAG: sugar phosphate isomerase/epimerase family protein [Phycisphaeraceae bacterium]
MKLSVTPISSSRLFRQDDMDLPGFIDFCAEHGCDAIDLLDIRKYTWLWKDARSDMRELPGWLESAGLKLAAYGCGNNFALADAGERAEQVDSIKLAVKEARDLGTRVTRIFGGHMPAAPEPPAVAVGFTRVVEAIEQCLPAAEQAGVVMALENHGALPGLSYEVEAIIAHFNSPSLQCTFDTGNFLADNMREVEDPIHALNRLIGHTAHVHVKDLEQHREPTAGTRRQACVAGEGDVPLRQLAAMLEAAGFDGYHSLEFEAGARMPERDGMARSLAFMAGLKEEFATLSPGADRIGAAARA